jgi:hypothetical protein
VSALAIPLSRIRPCLEGVIPSPIATCSASGIPNVTYLSIVRMVDDDHVALSFQFFSKTRVNVGENPRAQVIVVDPGSLRQFRLDLRFERSETAGPLFESMRTQLAAIASQTGMAKVFVLRGVDVYRVLACEAIGEHDGVDAAPARDPVETLDAFTRRIAACPDLEALLGGSLEALEDAFGYASSFLMLVDETGNRLFTIASRGYPASGVGSEVTLGEGLLGVAAQKRTIVRSTNLARDLVLSRAVRTAIEQQDAQGAAALEREIPLPGLPGALSQVAVPLLTQDQLLGLLCVQSERPGFFLESDARLVGVACRHLSSLLTLLEARAEQAPESVPQGPDPAGAAHGQAVVKYYESDDSVFIDDVYVIKGVAGRILWKLASSYVEEGRREFTNKQIRLDATLQLPDFKDNLEARLILLRRRLEERCEFLRLARTGRGRFRFEAERRLVLAAQP